MTRRVLYVAHPLAPTREEIAAGPRFAVENGWGSDHAIRRNIDLALRWLAWLRRSFPQDTFIAPWIATVMSLHGDDSSELREAGLVDDCAVVERCDGIVLCGSRISSGMRREMAPGGHRVGLLRPGEPWSVFDLTVLQYKAPPPDVDKLGMTIEEYIHEVTP